MNRVAQPSFKEEGSASPRTGQKLLGKDENLLLFSPRSLCRHPRAGRAALSPSRRISPAVQQALCPRPEMGELFNSILMDREPHKEHADAFSFPSVEDSLCVNRELRSQIATVDKPHSTQNPSPTAAVTGSTGVVTSN